MDIQSLETAELAAVASWQATRRGTPEEAAAYNAVQDAKAARVEFEAAARRPAEAPVVQTAMPEESAQEWTEAMAAELEVCEAEMARMARATWTPERGKAQAELDARIRELQAKKPRQAAWWDGTGAMERATAETNRRHVRDQSGDNEPW